MKPMGRRQQQIAREIKEVLAERLMRGLETHPELDARLIVFSDLWVSADLKVARTSYFFLDGALDKDREKAMTEVLNASAYLFQRAIAERLSLRFTPKISFSFDKARARMERLESLIERIHTNPSDIH